MCGWADLPDYLLDLITSNLVGKDRHSFSLVCRHWNTFSIAKASLYRHSPSLICYYPYISTWKFYRNDRIFNASFPELENADIRCSKYGWLLCNYGDGSLFFFNPSNYRKLELPGKIGMWIRLCFFNPPTSPDCMLIGIRAKKHNIEIWMLKRGEDAWSNMEYPCQKTHCWFWVAPPVLHRGLIHFLNTEGDVATFNIEQRRWNVYSMCLRKSEINPRKTYLVKVDEEEVLFGVFVIGQERRVKVFKLSLEMKWDLAEEGIGDKIFYLSNNTTLGCKADTKSMENKIYFCMSDGVKKRVGNVFYSLRDNKYYSEDGTCFGSYSCGLMRFEFADWVVLSEDVAGHKEE